MSGFIESLELRTLFSVTTAALASDLALIGTDAAAVKAAFVALDKGLLTDTKAIANDVKGPVKGNAPILAKFKSDEVKTLAKLHGDATTLLKLGVTASKHGVVDGAALLKMSNVKVMAKVQSDVMLLGTVTITPLTNLENDLQNSDVGDALTALAARNSANVNLASGISRFSNDVDDLGTAMVNAAQTFDTDVGALKADLSSLVS